MLAGWVNREQQAVIDYLREENTVLREQMGGRRLRFTDDQRRRLAAKGKALGRKALGALHRLGHEIGRNTIKRILNDHSLSSRHRRRANRDPTA